MLCLNVEILMADLTTMGVMRALLDSVVFSNVKEIDLENFCISQVWENTPA